MVKKITKLPAKKIRQLTTYMILILCTIVYIMPFLWMVSTSFKSNAEAYTFPPTIIPKNILLSNYIKGWVAADFTLYTSNTVFLAVVCTAGTVISAAVVAYGFAKFKGVGSKILYILMLSTMMLPVQVTLIPQYLLYHKMHMIDTYWPLIFPAWLGGGAYNIFLYYQFFRTLPRELDEAATIDGANSFQVFTQIMLPSVKPVCLAVGVMSLVYNWNDFYMPLIYLNSSKKYTIAIGLQFLNSSMGNTKIGMMMAVTVITLIPVLIIFFVSQKYFVEGIKLSGTKA